MVHPQQSKKNRNIAQTLRNSAKVEQYLMEIEKAYDYATSWKMRERFEKGEFTLEELLRR